VSKKISTKKQSNTRSSDANCPEIIQEPVRPRSPQLLIDEPTYEGLVKHLAEEQPSIGFISDEAGRFVSGYAMSKDNRLKTIAGLSSIWDGWSITRSRQKDGTEVLYDRRITCHWMMQPCVANILFGDELVYEQGLMARFLVCKTQALAGTRSYQDRQEAYQAVIKRYENLLMPLLNSPLKVKADGALQLRTLTLTKEAKQCWIVFYNEVEIQQGDNGRYHPIRGFASKVAEHALRLAGILAVVQDYYVETISISIINSAIQIMRFYVEENLRLAVGGSLSGELSLAEKVLDYVIKHHDQGLFCLIDIYQNGVPSVRNKKRAAQIISILEKHHHVFQYPTGAIIRGEYRRTVWQLHPIYLQSQEGTV